ALLARCVATLPAFKLSPSAMPDGLRSRAPAPPTPSICDHYTADSTGQRCAFARRRSSRLLVACGRRRGLAAVTLLVVGDRCLDRVFRENRAVDLHRRQRQFFGDVRVLDLERLIERLALHPF